MTPARPFFASVLLLVLPAVAQAGTASLVKDIQPGPTDASSLSANPSSPIAVGGRLFFQLFPQGGNPGLWVTDGTADGTRELGASRQILGPLGSVLIFSADDDALRTQLWRTDGTPAGTFPLTPLGGAPDASLREVILVGNRLFFTACRETGCAPWVSDGTVAGTRRLRAETPEAPEDFVSLGGEIFFRLGSDLWRTDGTAAGTRLAARFGAAPRQLASAGGRLFFLLDRGSGDELWVNAPAGSRRLLDFAAEQLLGIGTFRVIGNRIYFLGFDAAHGQELWVSDGTRPGTRRLTDFSNPRALDLMRREEVLDLGGKLVFPANGDGSGIRLWVADGPAAAPRPLCRGAGCVQYSPSNARQVLDPGVDLVRSGGRLIFPGFTSEHGRELWTTDGTSAGTRLLRDTCPGPCSGVVSPLQEEGGAVFFGAAPQPSAGQQLWRSDGTPAGTRRFAAAGVLPELNAGIGILGRRVFFSGDDLQHGRELWVSEGRAGTTRLLADLARRTEGSLPGGFVAAGDRLVFTACREDRRAVWSSAGTEASTLQLPVPEVSCLSGVGRSVAVGGTAFFSTFSGDLWASDGTVDGTRLLLDSVDVQEIVALQDRAVFTAAEGNIYSLWSSDGTVAGTHKVFELPERPFFLAGLGSEVYFKTADPQFFGSTVWKSDGTAAGTVPLRTFGSLTYSFFHRLGGAVYFATEGALWRSDGTPGGTRIAWNPGTVLGVFIPPVELGGHLVFLAHTGASYGLWRSDGTAAGTRLLRTFPGESQDNTERMAVLGDQVFFTARDTGHGQELWRSDGTPEGTVLVRDLIPGAIGSHPGELTVAGGRLYFRASDLLHGAELWQSDGTRAGTRIVQDIQPGPRSSRPARLTVAGSRLFFTADDGISGEELWVLP